MKTIWKLPLEPVVGTQVIEMPRGAQILYVQTQDTDTAYLWAIVESGNKLESRTILMAFTGKEFPKKPGSAGKAFYIGTFQINGLVWHVFEVK
jgi:hypothetical protein